jgi:hypothetical protein
MYIVLMVHSQFREKLMEGFLNRMPFVEPIIIPYHKVAQDKNVHQNLEDLHNEMVRRKIDPKEIEFVIVESNYGHPSVKGINEETFKELIHGYKNAQIIATSGTSESLMRALLYNKCIYVIAVGKKEELFTEEYWKSANEFLSRIYTMQEVKQLIERTESENCDQKMLIPAFKLQCSLDDKAEIKPEPKTPQRAASVLELNSKS